MTQSEATYEQAVAEHERNEKLIKSGAASQSEFDITLARKKRANAEVQDANEALKIGTKGAREEDLDAKRAEIRGLEASTTASQNQLDDATLIAPFDGEISAVYVDNFQRVQAKQPIARLFDLAIVVVTVQIPESLIGLVPQVKKVNCRFDALPNRDFIGTVSKVGREASQTTRTYPVTIEIPQPDDASILPGMAATVSNRIEESEASPIAALIIPASSVFTSAEDQGQTFVWVFDEANNTVGRRAIITGELTPVGLKVVEGLQAGEQVIISGVNSLREGQEVKLQ